MAVLKMCEYINFFEVLQKSSQTSISTMEILKEPIAVGWGRGGIWTCMLLVIFRYCKRYKITKIPVYTLCKPGNQEGKHSNPPPSLTTL